jgi:site-specific DNA-methyltransferase (adenine-specific)
MNINKIENIDCKDYLKNVGDESVNLIVIDPPYNELPKEWDNFKEWETIKKEFTRILKKEGQVYIFGKQPMLADVYSQIKDLFDFRFELVWNKGKGFWTSNFTPMRSHELIWCFKKKGVKTSSVYFDLESIKTPGEPYVRKNKVVSTVRNNWKANHTIFKDGRRFPLSVLSHSAVSRKNKIEGTEHPTQKPLDILKWIVKSSSKEGDVVLDCFMGSGTTAIACLSLNRKFIGCETDKKFYSISEERIKRYLSGNGN